MLTFQALANSRFFRHDCGVNISCRSHVLQADFFLKIYSIIWLSQNFLGYNSITINYEFNVFYLYQIIIFQFCYLCFYAFLLAIFVRNKNLFADSRYKKGGVLIRTITDSDSDNKEPITLGA
jgi:hypothetical protein